MAIAAATIAATSTLVVAPPNVNVSRLEGPQNEPTIAIDPSDDRILLAGFPLTRLGVPVAQIRRSERCDQFWPQSAVDPSNGTLWACFYDTKGDRARKRARYTCAVSVNGGTRWSRPLAVASVASDATQKGVDPREYGDYEGLAVANGIAHPIWTDMRDVATLQEEIYRARVTEPDVRGSP